MGVWEHWGMAAQGHGSMRALDPGSMAPWDQTMAARVEAFGCSDLGVGGWKAVVNVFLGLSHEEIAFGEFFVLVR